jgi:hypothetical protein
MKGGATTKTNGKDSAWTPRYAGLTRTRVLHCEMELIFPHPIPPPKGEGVKQGRKNRAISGSPPGSHARHIFPSRDNYAPNTRG